MKKPLTLLTIFTGLLVLLAPVGARAQQQVAALRPRSDGPRLEAGSTARPSAAEYRSQINVLQRRKASLRRYLSSVSPDSADYKATERSLADIGVKLDDLARDLVSLEFPQASAPSAASRSRAARGAARVESVAPSAEAAAGETSGGSFAAPQTDELKADLVLNDGSFASISVDVRRFTGDKIKVEATDSDGKPVWGNSFDVKRSDTVFTVPNVRLARSGATTITVSSFDDKVSTTVSVPASSSTTKTMPRREGGAVGYTVGGMVVSQQAQNFNQADPFVGFIAGYDSSDHGPLKGFAAWRWHLRFQGIFTSSGRTAEETETAEGTDPEPEPAATPDPFKFIASRKTFDVDAHMWVDFWARNAFSIGPYIAWGASTVMDKNELQGEAVIVDKNNDGQPDDNKVVTSSQSDNDLKQFREYGMLMNLTVGDEDKPALFLQAILARGWYEALKDLDRDDDTRRRFIGKLRIFPKGINNFTEVVTPMFGVELNAGTGPDQVKFFTGFAVKLKGLSITGK